MVKLSLRLYYLIFFTPVSMASQLKILKNDYYTIPMSIWPKIEPYVWVFIKMATNYSTFLMLMLGLIQSKTFMDSWVSVRDGLMDLSLLLIR